MKRITRPDSRLSLEFNRYAAALDDVSLSVEAGEIFGVVGQAGSGKSTLMRILGTLIVPDRGEARVFGLDVVRQAHQVQNLTNRVSVVASLFPKRTVLENLLAGQRNTTVSTRNQEYIRSLLERLGVAPEQIQRPAGELNRKDQQKVSLAWAILSRPRLLLLDEPLTGLDRQGRLALFDLLWELREEEGVTVLLTGNSLYELNDLCDRIAVLDEGRLIASGTPGALERFLAKNASRSMLTDLVISTLYD
jgi:ABC-2 type transport system ATP-binding protein